MPVQQNNMSLIDGSNDIKLFIKAYNEARGQYKSQFLFKGSQVLVTYAYYTIEYLAMSKQIKGKFNDAKIFEYDNN